ncbi:MAG: DUF2064 domain-containing protein [Psychrobium sp.]|nr:DUF2064 domain-containing protein [Psychrobium sp.]
MVLLCKHPALHHAKQRLAAGIGAESALVFANLMLNCALQDLKNWVGATVITPANPIDTPWAQTLVGDDSPALVLEQGQGNLGQRINFLDHQLRALGHQHIIFMGSDAPMLTDNDFKQISHALTQDDIALSPALDGGVTLMANRLPWPDLSQLPWSTVHLGSALKRLCNAQQLSVKETSITYDIDHEADLYRLKHSLAEDNRSSRISLLRAIHGMNIGINGG